MSLPAGSHLVHLNTQSSLPAFADATTALEAGLFMIGVVGLLVISYRIIFRKPSTRVRRFTNVRQSVETGFHYDPETKRFSLKGGGTFMIHEPGKVTITINNKPEKK